MGVHAADVAAFLDPVEEQRWRNPDSLSACVAGSFFDVDHRNRDRQRYCSATPCRRASKTASQAAWLIQPMNAGYFSDPVHVKRVQAWRGAHPGYSRTKPGKIKTLQDSLIAQVTVFVEQTAIRAETPAPPAISALQDLLNAPSPVLAGLIAHLFEVTLQETHSCDHPALDTTWARCHQPESQ